jgi:outer membrane protein OmpA-like peptidoglycan-associated protein
MNLGYPINTVYNEQSLFVSRDGTIGLFASDRAEDDNGLDIYSFDLYPEARPTYVSYAQGKITDAKTGKPIEATINLIDLKNSNKIAAPNSDPSTGEYILCLPSERNYMLNISQKGYLPYSEHFALEKTHEQKPLQINIKLQPIELNARVILKNIFFELDSYELKPESKIELGKLIQFLETNPTVAIEISGHTDNQGSKEHNKILSQNRAKTVYNYLIRHNIKASRLSYKGYGFEQAIATNDTKKGRALNRRTEFKIIKM